jgi:hypothetical protein
MTRYSSFGDQWCDPNRWFPLPFVRGLIHDAGGGTPR